MPYTGTDSRSGVTGLPSTSRTKATWTVLMTKVSYLFSSDTFNRSSRTSSTWTTLNTWSSRYKQTYHSHLAPFPSRPTVTLRGGWYRKGLDGHRTWNTEDSGTGDQGPRGLRNHQRWTPKVVDSPPPDSVSTLNKFFSDRKEGV